ncbi:MAG: UDP-3-O-acyl-N-acetylglucosamine deacetylase [Candidatus Omnitrophota bacterium]
MQAKQKTIQRETSVHGKGLHLGKEAKVIFKPAKEHSGICFVRVDLPGSPTVKAEYKNILHQEALSRCTSLKDGEAIVHTVEHLMAVLYGLQIDNLIVEIDAEELPGLDGSGQDYYQALKKAVVVDQAADREFIDIKEPICLEEKESSLFATPASELKVSYMLDYEHPMLAAQFFSREMNAQVFEKEISPSRTFCLESEAQSLQSQGLGKGANHTNTLVVTDKGVKDNELRFPDEFVRHKILDYVEDLYLLGKPVRGHILGMKSGHRLNRRLLQKIVEQQEKYEKQFTPKAHEHAHKTVIDINGIRDILPHRYPFLFVDRVIELTPGKRAVAVKNVTANEPFFQGHFPDKPVMPGVLMVEAMAQVGGIAVLTDPENKDKLALFMAIDNVKFRKVVEPGDQLIFEVDVLRCKSRFAQVKGVAKVDGKVVVEADLMFSFTDLSYLKS